jgi:hypothetical protein
MVVAFPPHQGEVCMDASHTAFLLFNIYFTFWLCTISVNGMPLPNSRGLHHCCITMNICR